MTLGKTDGLSRIRGGGIHINLPRHLSTTRSITLASISGKVESIFYYKELCRGLNAREFQHATKEHFIDMLCDAWQAHFRLFILALLQQVRPPALQINLPWDIHLPSIFQEKDPSHFTERHR